MEKTTIQEDRERVMILDQLYIEEGRHHKDHPHHGVYTDLWQGWLRKQKSEIIARALTKD